MTKVPKLIAAISNFASYQLYVNQTSGGQYQFSGIYGKYIELVLEAWKGEYEIFFCNDFDLGKKGPDGNWTGKLGAVSRGQADIGISHMAISTTRNEIVDFSTAYTMGTVTFAVQKWTQEDVFHFLLLFDRAVWISIFISLIILSGLFFLILRGKENYSSILLNTFGNIIGKSLDLHKDLFKWKQLLGCWFLCAFIMSCSYSAVLLSFLTLPPQSKILKDFRDLSEAVQKGTHRAYAASGSWTISFMANSEAEYLKRLGNAMTKNKWYIDFDSVFVEKRDSKNVLVMARAMLKFLFGAGDLKSSYYISSDALFVVPVGIAMNKNFCCKSRINKIVTRMASANLDGKLLNDISFRYWLDVSSKLTNNEAQGSHPLSMKDLTGSFVILCIGLGCSLLVFLGEIVLASVHKKKKDGEIVLANVHKKKKDKNLSNKNDYYKFGNEYIIAIRKNVRSLLENESIIMFSRMNNTK